MNVQLARFGVINSESCSFCSEQSKTHVYFSLEGKFVDCF